MDMLDTETNTKSFYLSTNNHVLRERLICILTNLKRRGFQETFQVHEAKLIWGAFLQVFTRIDPPMRYSVQHMVLIIKYDSHLLQQLFNHFPNVLLVATKLAMHRNFSNHGYAFYPRSYDISDQIQAEAFVLDASHSTLRQSIDGPDNLCTTNNSSVMHI